MRAVNLKTQIPRDTSNGHESVFDLRRIRILRIETERLSANMVAERAVEAPEHCAHAYHKKPTGACTMEAEFDERVAVPSNN